MLDDSSRVISPAGGCAERAAALAGVDGTAGKVTLAARGMSALQWNALGAGVRAVCQLGVTSLLARELGPGPFGIAAAALIIVGLANLVADGGIGAAIIQAEAVDDLVLRYAFTLQMAVGVAAAGTITMLAEPAGRLFGDPALPDVLVLMSLYFVIQAFGETADSMLRRRLEFRLLQGASIGSYLLGYGVVGLTLAFRGAGVWSLVIAHLSQAVIYSAAAYSMVRHPLRPRIRPSPGLLRFGASAMSVNMANWALSNADNFVVGRYFGTVGLGLYSRAYNLMYAPIQGVVVTVQQVLFPIYSRAGKTGASVRNTYLSSVNGIALCMFPTFLSAALVANTVVVGLYGPKWTGAAAMLIPLSLSMPLYGVMGMAGPVLWGRGEALREFRIQAVAGVLFAVALVVAVRESPVAVAWTVLGVSTARAVLMTGIAMKTLDIPRTDLVRCVKGPLILGLFTALVVRGVDEILSRGSVPAEVRLLALTTAGAGCVAVAVGRAGSRLLIEESLSRLVRFPWIRRREGRVVSAPNGGLNKVVAATTPYPTADAPADGPSGPRHRRRPRR